MYTSDTILTFQHRRHPNGIEISVEDLSRDLKQKFPKGAESRFFTEYIDNEYGKLERCLDPDRPRVWTGESAVSLLHISGVLRRELIRENHAVNASCTPRTGNEYRYHVVTSSDTLSDGAINVVIDYSNTSPQHAARMRSAISSVIASDSAYLTKRAGRGKERFHSGSEERGFLNWVIKNYVPLWRR